MKQKPTRLQIIINTTLLLLVGFMVLNVALIQNRLRGLNRQSELAETKYQKHFALITDEGDSKFWDAVFQAAREEGERQEIFVERMGSNLITNYNKEELLQIALDASVDGIILTGGETKELNALIDKAKEKEIPVVTVREDSTSDGRVSFVGISSYNLGKTYGEKLMELSQGQIKKVNVLLDANRKGPWQEIILSGLRDTMNEEMVPDQDRVEIEGVFIDSSKTFDAEEQIRDYFLNGEVGDAVICVDPVFTKCVYQTVVDYNMVGDQVILGYYTSGDILEVVSRNVIQGTVGVDTESMGRQSVEALSEYLDSGYASNFIAVNIQMIGQKEATTLLREDQQRRGNESE